MKQAIKRRLTGLVLSAILLAALALPAFAADIPAAPSGHAVLDQAGVLSEETINTVDGYNNALASTGAEIGVLTVDFTGNLSIDDYALQVFNEWGIGDKKKQNGVLFLLVTGDENYYCTLGTGLEGEITYSRLKSLLNDYAEPGFAKGDYDACVTEFTDALYSELCSLYGITPGEGQPQPKPVEQDDSDLSGVLLQAVLKNPLADPGIIGISSGASLVAVLITAFFPALYFFTPLFAFLGGMLAFFLVYSLSWKGGLSPLRIILVGVAVNAMFSGLMSAFNSGTGSNYSGVASIVNANITMKTWSDLQTLLLYGLVGLIASFFVLGQCNLLALEDKTARSLGVNVNRSRIVISVIAVLLAGIATAVIGPISFLGLIVPHIARLLVGSNHKILVPYTILLGAFTLLLADTVGRTIAAPYEISASVIMSVVGGPFFIILLRRSRQSYGQ